ncbi:PTS glucose transporter subunit IIA [Marinococcus sp. PL1-022]|uniref:PTS sugar transporter subunit IIA n=1 Tax=Marinococcus sp. PL1-022 TaxID=3095363 RepID=UPI0029C5F3DA|nr:PTS glucose transporter subunit IIA [Marinococcus sp. PL1-022]MDX6153059.1 PTS glucose transporter subunit IIA [Marinococcus sp. PL1-022]
MLKKLFGKEQKPVDVSIKSPVSGAFVDITEVPDPTFSEKMMGEGFAVDPSEGIILSPVKGRVEQIFPTKHAVGIRSEEGLDILIHIGLETVSLDGEGFTCKVSEGDSVEEGDLLMEFDMDVISEKAASKITPVVFTEGDQVENIQMNSENRLKAGETVVATVTVKK